MTRNSREFDGQRRYQRGGCQTTVEARKCGAARVAARLVDVVGPNALSGKELVSGSSARQGIDGALDQIRLGGSTIRRIGVATDDGASAYGA